MKESQSTYLHKMQMISEGDSDQTFGMLVQADRVETKAVSASIEHTEKGTFEHRKQMDHRFRFSLVGAILLMDQVNLSDIEI